jgi:surfactin synthase thioesterase subunit
MGTWLRCAEARPYATTRLVCFPHAGGSAVAFRSWQRRIAPSVEVHAVQYPGRGDRLDDAIIDDAATLVREVSAELRSLSDRPLALFGHSMGALIAYEVARGLDSLGAAPVHLFVSGCRPPDHHDRGPGLSELDDEELAEVLAAMGGTDVEVLADPELREMVLPYVRADFRLVETYTYKPDPPLSAPVTSLVGAADPLVSATQAAGWAGLTSGPFTQRVLPGDHFYLVPERDEVIAEIQARLGI